MLPIWLNLLLTMPSYLIILSLGLLILKLKIRYTHLILIVIVVSIINVGLEYWVTNPLIKVVVPIIGMIYLYSYLSEINILKSAIAVVMGANVYTFIESLTLLISYNLLKIYTEEFLNTPLIYTCGILFTISCGLGIIALIKIFKLELYNLSKITDNNHENKNILITLLLFIGMPFLLYIWLTVYILTIKDFSFVLNIGILIFLLYFFIVCYLLRYTEVALQKIFKDKADESLYSLYHKLIKSVFAIKQDLTEKINDINNLLKQQNYTGIRKNLNLIMGYFRLETLADHIQIHQLRWFFQIEYIEAQERGIDLILNFSDLSGLEAYVDEDFIDMLEHLCKNAREGTRTAEFKEIYIEIAKDDKNFIILIKNNGIVLPSDHQSHLFELGYTTKNSPNRGYGLYIVKKLVDYYQGSIEIRGSDGYTQVTIKLPFKEGYKIKREEYTVDQLEKGEKSKVTLSLVTNKIY